MYWPKANVVKKMRKLVLAGFLILYASALNVFATQTLNSEDLPKQIKEVSGHIKSINTKIAESIIKELKSPTDPGIILSLKSIHSLTVVYPLFRENFYEI